MPPDPVERSDRPRPGTHHILPFSSVSSGPEPKSRPRPRPRPGATPRPFSFPTSRQIFGNENQLPLGSMRSRSLQIQPGISSSGLATKDRPREPERPFSKLRVNVDRANQDRSRSDTSVMVGVSSAMTMGTAILPPSDRLSLDRPEVQRDTRHISPRSTVIPLKSPPDRSRSRSRSQSLTPLSSQASPIRTPNQAQSLSQATDKPIYVFQSGRPKRRVTIEKEQKKLRVDSSPGDSQSSSHGSHARRHHEEEEEKRIVPDKPKRVRIRDRTKERDRARELRRLRKLAKEMKEKEALIRKRNRSRKDSISASSETSAIEIEMKPSETIRLGPPRSGVVERTTRSRTRRAPLSDIRTRRVISTSPSASPSPTSRTPCQFKGAKLTAVPQPGSEVDSVTGPEEIEAALIIGGLIRDARVRRIEVGGRSFKWDVRVSLDMKRSIGIAASEFNGNNKMDTAWRTCLRCGVQYLVDEKGKVIHDRPGQICRFCDPCTETVSAPKFDGKTLPPILFKHHVDFDPRYEDSSISATQRARLPPIQTSMLEYHIHPASESEVSTILSTEGEFESNRPESKPMEFLTLGGSSCTLDNSHKSEQYHEYNHERETDWLGGMNGPITRFAMSEGLPCLPAWKDMAYTKLKRNAGDTRRGFTENAC